jgi:hypothetical protein
VHAEQTGQQKDMTMRLVLAAALAAASLAPSVQTVFAADLSLKTRAHHHRVYAVGRPWCVIENVGVPVWTCAPTRAACHAFEVPGTSLYCVRDPVPGRAYALR